jgi:hypothetical protein
MLRLALEASRESAQAAQLKPQPHHSRMPASFRPAIQQQPLERRAPVLVQKAGMEWAWRLAQNPKRLWRRYLVDDPAILRLLWREARSRR